ncbi:hypothetical protein RB597_000186 [Gaeumannomyces tritici]
MLDLCGLWEALFWMTCSDNNTTCSLPLSTTFRATRQPRFTSLNPRATMQQSKLKRLLLARKHVHEQQQQQPQDLLRNEAAPFRGYLPTHPSILDHSLDAAVSAAIPPLQGAATSNPPAGPAPPARNRGPSPPPPNNPYLAAIAAKERSMTLAYIRTIPPSSSSQPSADLPTIPADDRGFGQRYQQLHPSAAPVVTHTRVPAALLTGGPRDCVVCADTLPASRFPALAVTRRCAHPPRACLRCVAASIAADLAARLQSWDYNAKNNNTNGGGGGSVRCPECAAPLAYDDVQLFADPPDRARYQALSFRAVAAAAAPGFRWCPAAGCGSGQACGSGSGSGSGRAECVRCGAGFCVAHDVTWHEGLTCAEYDGLLADPDGGGGGGGAREEEEEEEDEDTREGRERAERARLVHEARRRAAQRGRELRLTEATIFQTTKRCPGCRWPIEKNKGCSHITCTMCSYEFCYDCGLKWMDGCRNTSCGGA